VSRKYESSRGQTEFSPQPILPWKWKQYIQSNRQCTLGQHYECCTLRYSYTATPLCAYMVSYRTKCTFTFNIVPFSAGYCTVRTASTCAVPGFTSRRAAQVSAITALCCMCSRPPWGDLTRSAFWREHRQTLKSFKVVCRHYCDMICQDIFVNFNWVDTRWQ
jgi:hypothetical protein